MPVNARRFLFLALTLSLFALPTLAQQGEYGAPGEMDAVMRFCGNPKGISKGISPVTNTLQRNLIYSDTLILHFQPIKGGWSFTTGWDGHLPVTREQLIARMPCFRKALAEAANAPATPKATTDPTIANQQEDIVPFNNSNYGIPHLYLIVTLAVILLLCLAIPTAKQRRRRKLELAERNYRKPDVGSSASVKKHVDTDLYQ